MEDCQFSAGSQFSPYFGEDAGPALLVKVAGISCREQEYVQYSSLGQSYLRGGAMLFVDLFGPMRVTDAAGRDLTPHGQRARAILAMVLMAENARRSRNWLADHLWSDKPRELALTSLRQSIREIRKCLPSGHETAFRADNFSVTADRSVLVVRPRSGSDDFLEGIDIADPEFEEWLTLERSRLTATATVDRMAAKPAENVQAAPPPIFNFALRIDPPMLAGPHDETQRAADSAISGLLLLLSEDGFTAIDDRRPGALAIRQPSGNSALALRSKTAMCGDWAEVTLALVSLTSGENVWFRRLNARSALLHDGRDPGLAAALLQCSEQVWREKDAAARRARAGEDDADCIRAAVQDIFALGAEDFSRAESELHQLVQGPQAGLAHAWLAFVQTFKLGQRLARHETQVHDAARMHAAKALEREPANALVLALTGHVQSYVFANYLRAVELFESAIRLNPGRALPWDLYAVLHGYIGRPEAGLRCAQYARHLGANSPYSFYYDASCLITAGLSGDAATAIRHGESVLDATPDYSTVLRHLAASYAHAGARERAEDMRQRILLAEPGFSIQSLREAREPGLDTPGGQHFIRGLKKAGIREVGK